MLVFISVFCVGPLIQSFINNSNNNIPEQPTSLHTSETYSNTDIILPDGWYHWRNIGVLYSGDRFWYSYYTNHSSCNLNVYVLDAEDFDDKYEGRSYTIYRTIAYSDDMDSGYEYVYKDDTFYVIFETIGDDCELSYYTITTYPSSPPPDIFNILMSVFIPLIIIVIIGVAVSTMLQRRRAAIRTAPLKASASPSTPVTQPPVTSASPKPEPQPESMKSSMGYCKYCGEKTEIDAAFCPQCGTKF